jgi:hypothetical protein
MRPAPAIVLSDPSWPRCAGPIAGWPPKTERPPAPPGGTTNRSSCHRLDRPGRPADLGKPGCPGLHPPIGRPPPRRTTPPPQPRPCRPAHHCPAYPAARSSAPGRPRQRRLRPTVDPATRSQDAATIGAGKTASQAQPPSRTGTDATTAPLQPRADTGKHRDDASMVTCKDSSLCAQTPSQDQGGRESPCVSPRPVDGDEPGADSCKPLAD